MPTYCDGVREKLRIGDAEPCAYYRPGTGERVEP